MMANACEKFNVIGGLVKDIGYGQSATYVRQLLWLVENIFNKLLIFFIILRLCGLSLSLNE